MKETNNEKGQENRESDERTAKTNKKRDTNQPTLHLGRCLSRDTSHLASNFKSKMVVGWWLVSRVFANLAYARAQGASSAGTKSPWSLKSKSAFGSGILYFLFDFKDPLFVPWARAQGLGILSLLFQVFLSLVSFSWFPNIGLINKKNS